MISNTIFVTDLFTLRRQKVDEGRKDGLGHRQALLFPGFVKTQIHEKRGRVFEAVRRRLEGELEKVSERGLELVPLISKFNNSTVIARLISVTRCWSEN